MLATWDDHDFGQNDAGASFAFKERAERVYETYWGSLAAVRSRPGVQDSIIVRPGGKRVQIILLGTRFFRGELRSLPGPTHCVRLAITSRATMSLPRCSERRSGNGWKANSTNKPMCA